MAYIYAWRSDDVSSLKCCVVPKHIQPRCCFCRLTSVQLVSSNGLVPSRPRTPRHCRHRISLICTSIFRELSSWPSNSNLFPKNTSGEKHEGGARPCDTIVPRTCSLLLQSAAELLLSDRLNRRGRCFEASRVDSSSKFLYRRGGRRSMLSVAPRSRTLLGRMPQKPSRSTNIPTDQGVQPMR